MEEWHDASFSWKTPSMATETAFIFSSLKAWGICLVKVVRIEYVDERMTGLLDFKNSRKKLCTENIFSAEDTVAILALVASFCSVLTASESLLFTFIPSNISTRVATASRDDEITCNKIRIQPHWKS